MSACKALIVGLLIVSAAPALSQPADDPALVTGVYVGLRGSYAFSGNHTTTWAGTTPMTQMRGSYASGGGGSLVMGTHLPLNLRVELEGLYRYQPLSKFTLDGVKVAASGRSQNVGGMMNLLWDIPVPLESPLQPFVGMGVGALHTDVDASGGGNTYMHQSRWAPAYSFMTGFALPLDESSRLTAMYRWMQVPNAHHKCAVSGTTQFACLDNPVSSSAVDLGFEMEL